MARAALHVQLVESCPHLALLRNHVGPSAVEATLVRRVPGCTSGAVSCSGGASVTVDVMSVSRWSQLAEVCEKLGFAFDASSAGALQSTLEAVKASGGEDALKVRLCLHVVVLFSYRCCDTCVMWRCADRWWRRW
jgi:hypothetical protein